VRSRRCWVSWVRPQRSVYAWESDAPWKHHWPLTTSRSRRPVVFRGWRVRSLSSPPIPGAARSARRLPIHSVGVVTRHAGRSGLVLLVVGALTVAAAADSARGAAPPTSRPQAASQAPLTQLPPTLQSITSDECSTLASEPSVELASPRSPPSESAATHHTARRRKRERLAYGVIVRRL
jgi:hypothetical protein